MIISLGLDGLDSKFGREHPIEYMYVDDGVIENLGCTQNLVHQIVSALLRSACAWAHLF